MTTKSQTSSDTPGLADDELICALTGDVKKAKPEEHTLQAIIEQLHREYRIPFADMSRDVKVSLEREDPKTGRMKKKSVRVQLAVFTAGEAHDQAHMIRAIVVAKQSSKPTDKAIALFDEILGNLDADEVYGMWTNGDRQSFRMRTYNDVDGAPIFASLTDFPAPHETLEDLNDANRRPLRIATKESLVRAFKGQFDYREPLLTWFVHKVPNISARDLEGLGLTEVGADLATTVKELRNHEFLCKTLGVSGKFAHGNTFWRFRQDAWVAQNPERMAELQAEAEASGVALGRLLASAMESEPPDLRRAKEVDDE